MGGSRRRAWLEDKYNGVLRLYVFSPLITYSLSALLSVNRRATADYYRRFNPQAREGLNPLPQRRRQQARLVSIRRPVLA